MFALLSPRLWLVLGIASFLALTHFSAYRKGRNDVRLQWTAATAQANNEARALEQQRQRRVDEASSHAALRQSNDRADATRAGGSLERLRDALAARHLAEESIASAVKRADTAEKLLLESAGAYRELAATCDRHVNDVRLLIESWPK